MRKLIFILAGFLPLLGTGQNSNLSSVMLNTLDERKVRASELFQENESYMIYFFNQLSSEVLDHLGYLESLQSSCKFSSNTKIMAVYSTADGYSGKIMTFLSGSDITIETYLDVNGELQRIMGLPGNSTVLVAGIDPKLPERYSGSLACTGELENLVALFSDFDKANREDPGNTWVRSTFSGK